jgi:hypothetical protein
VLSKELLSDLQRFVDIHINAQDFAVFEEKMSSMASQYEYFKENEMEAFIKKKKQPSFNELLFKHIDKIGMKDSDLYKKAGIDRRHFSKIRSNLDYHPSKNTAIALALSLELSQKEVEKLIGAAGYTLTDSETFDLVITFCLERKIYDINNVNLALDYFSLKPLAGASG